MSVEFEWRLQDEPLPDPSGPPVRRRGWRRPLVWGAAALVLVLAVLCAWWRISRNASVQGEGQVEAVVRLEIEATASGDRELYLSLQDPVLRAWYDTYETPAAQGQFLPSVLPGLAATTGISVASVRVVGDLARVELLRSIESPDALPVTFRATRFYRRDASGRWLHARLDRDYAGHVMVWVGEHVELTGYAADAETFTPAAADLERLATSFCDLVSCSGSAPVSLIFTGTLEGSESGFALPAPLLAGVPVDERSRDVWQAALRSLLVDRLLDAEFGTLDVGEEGRSLGAVLLDVRLRVWARGELGLRESLEPDLAYLSQALEEGSWMLSALWEIPADAGYIIPGQGDEELELLIDFVGESYGRDGIVAMWRALPDADSLETLISLALGEDWSDFLSSLAVHIRDTVPGAASFPSD